MHSMRHMNDIEREAIILNSAWDMIDGMVNWEMFCHADQPQISNVMFETRMHTRLFLILLGDFLAQTTGRSGKPIPLGLAEPPRGTTEANLTFLFHLRQVCSAPVLGDDSMELSISVEAFATWLEQQFVAEAVNLESVGPAIDITISRVLYLRMCADIAKHNLARLERNMQRLKALLATAGHPVEDHDAYVNLDSFYTWFENIFIYHAGQIAEHLNNIRWAIYRYLMPEYARSWHRLEGWTELHPMYGYHVPAEIGEPVARAMYWDVMNRCRAKPYVGAFTIPDHQKGRY